MAHMPNIAREAAEAVFHHHHHQPETETHPMTTPAPQPSILSNVATYLHHVATDVISELDANPLISTLAEHHLGKLLQPGEIQTVLSFVAGLEAVRQPQRAPQPVQDGTLQPPA